MCNVFLASPSYILTLPAECDSRPPLPNNSRFNTQGLQDILRACWSTKPTQRPIFSKVVKDFKQLRKSSGQEIVDSPRIPVIDEESETPSPSPDMRPTSFIEHLQAADNDLCEHFPPRFSLRLCLLAEKRKAFYQTWVTYFRTHNKFLTLRITLILKLLSRLKM